VVLKDEVLRLTDLPLIIKLPGMPQVARGTQVKLDLLRWDEVDLTIEARLLEIAAPPSAEAVAEANEELAEIETDGQADTLVEQVSEVAMQGELPRAAEPVPE